jgi:hypothetical protein
LCDRASGRTEKKRETDVAEHTFSRLEINWILCVLGKKMTQKGQGVARRPF